MNCKICSTLFQEFLEKSLCEELIAEMDDHMQACRKCRTSLRTYKLTIMLSQQADPPCCVRPETVDRLKKILLQRFFAKEDVKIKV
ncbi:MAG TPA: hypothetical protein PLA83_12440 [Deltaproteobacteria bacterium]|jgi:predicted anti-sigma-YlaC factor YlaD|nr:hypothetical protein [Deltaproteobacteria bacterium]HQI01204.1 hypothetical protein [Deltaproteobacteria bacterium]